MLVSQGDRHSKAVKKVNADAIVKAEAAEETSDPAYLQFAASEKASLMAIGVVDEAAIKEEIDRRWSVVTAMRSPPVQPMTETATADDVTVPVQLSDAQLVKANLTFVGPTTCGQFMYVRNTVSSSKPAKAKPVGEKSADEASDTDKASNVALSGKKRAAPAVESEPEPREVEDEMKWPCSVAENRLLKRATRESIVAMLADFGMPTKGSREELALDLSVQLHYETETDDDNNAA